MTVENAQSRWTKNNLVNVQFRLNKQKDADIIAKLDNVPNKQGYIKQLIRQDIAASTTENK